jgi:hypothetical protein
MNAPVASLTSIGVMEIGQQILAATPPAADVGVAQP